MAGTLGHILVVDDDAANLEVLKIVLDDLGYSAATVQNPEEALAACSERSPDLLMADFHLSGTTTSVPLIKQLRETRPDLPVLIMTGDAYARQQLPALDRMLVVEKPMGYQNIENAFAALLPANNPDAPANPWANPVIFPADTLA